MDARRSLLAGECRRRIGSWAHRAPVRLHRDAPSLGLGLRSLATAGWVPRADSLHVLRREGGYRRPCAGFRRPPRRHRTGAVRPSSDAHPAPLPLLDRSALRAPAPPPLLRDRVPAPVPCDRRGPSARPRRPGAADVRRQRASDVPVATRLRHARPEPAVEPRPPDLLARVPVLPHRDARRRRLAPPGPPPRHPGVGPGAEPGARPPTRCHGPRLTLAPRIP